MRTGLSTIGTFNFQIMQIKKRLFHQILAFLICSFTLLSYSNSLGADPKPNLSVVSITPDVSCTSDSSFDKTISVRITNSSPDLVVNADTLSVSGARDGQVTVSGNVTLANNACSAVVTSDIPMRFTLYDDTGCCGTQVAQWVETFSGINIAAGGGTQVLSLTPRSISSDLCYNSTGCQVSLYVEADYSDSICECDGTNNSWCADNISIDIPDLIISSDTLGISCLADGQALVDGSVVVANNGCGGNMTTDIPMRFTLYDNSVCSGNVVAQWAETFSGVNIAAYGGTQTFYPTPHSISADLCSNSNDCLVSIHVEADYSDSIYECDGTNNSWCADNKPIDTPDLRISSGTLDISCLADGQARVAGSVVVANNGCGGNMTTDIPMRFTLYDNTGCSGTQVAQWVETFSGVNIAAGGGTQGFGLTAHSISADLCSNSNDCLVSVHVEADYSDTICESDGNNNIFCLNSSVDIADLKVTAVTPAAHYNADGSVGATVIVSVENSGGKDAAGAVVRLTSSCPTITFADQTVSLASGSHSNLIFDFTPGTGTCDFIATFDPGNEFCESNGSNNVMAFNNFTTDSDGDELLDIDEQGPDGTDLDYDGNSDGTPDKTQVHVVSFATADGNDYVTLAAPAGTQFSGVTALNTPGPGIFPDQSVFPFGLFRFTLGGIAPGGSVQVKLFLPPGSSCSSYWKYGKEPGNEAMHPYRFMYSGLTGAQVKGNPIILHFQDGLKGDDDLNQGNGIIVDDGGPAVDSAMIPTLSGKGRILYLILMSLIGYLMIRKKAGLALGSRRSKRLIL